MSQTFTRSTFKYLEQATKNKNNEKWFEKNKNLFEQEVKQPFTEVILKLKKELQADLPLIDINPRSISRPLRNKNRVTKDNGIVKNVIYISLAEKKTSLFEWNPGIYIQIGPDTDDNFVGLGLYMVSSRQLSLLRSALVDDFENIDSIIKDKKFRKAWGEVKGEKYKRFPKGFNEQDPRSQYLWYKQFYLGKSFTRKEAQSKQFANQLVKDIKVALPFFKWIRKTVGTFNKKMISRPSRDFDF